MIELLLQRKAQLKELYKKSPDIELVYRLREVELMIKRYKKLIEAEVDAAGFREELGNLVVLMSWIGGRMTQDEIIEMVRASCDKR